MMPMTTYTMVKRVLGLKGHRIDNSNTHGTGCTLSSAIASNLAKGYTLEESVRHAKAYLSGAIGAMLDLGQEVVLWIMAIISKKYTIIP